VRISTSYNTQINYVAFTVYRAFSIVYHYITDLLRKCFLNIKENICFNKIHALPLIRCSNTIRSNSHTFYINKQKSWSCCLHLVLLLSTSFHVFLYIHTYRSHLIPEGVAEASQIIFRDAQVLPKWLSYGILQTWQVVRSSPSVCSLYQLGMLLIL
jgi:hypothetical protein